MRSWHVKAPLRGPLPLVTGVALCLGIAILTAGSGDLSPSVGRLLPLWLLWSAGAALAAFHQRGQAVLSPTLLAVGIALRVLMLGSPASLSDDLWRYLWEGRVLLSGENPFSLAPNAPELLALRNDTWAQVAHRDIPSIYPPLAQSLFAALSALYEAPISWKLLSGAADVGTLWMLAKGARQRGIPAWAPTLYALHPLPILETAGSGHLEGVALFFAAWALTQEPGRASFLSGLGAGVKVLPGALWIPLLRSAPKRAALGAGLALLVLTAASLPLLDAGPALLGGFGSYYTHWSFNASLFNVLRPLGAAARPVGTLLGAGFVGWAAWRLRDPAAFFLAVTGALVLLSPVVHPWYLLWPLLPALLRGRWEWAVLASTGLLSYAVLAGYDGHPETWKEPAWVVWAEYLPAAAAALWASRQRRSLGAGEDPGAP